MVRTVIVAGAALAGAVTGRLRAERAISTRTGDERVKVGGWYVQQGDAMFRVALARAQVARFGPFPVRPEEVVYLTTTLDESGARLTADRHYRVTGRVIDAGFWSIAAYDKERYFFPNDLERFSLSSVTAPIEEGSFAFDLGPAVGPLGEPGWLPTRGDGPVILVLRLYGPTPAVVGALAEHVPTVVAIGSEGP